MAQNRAETLRRQLPSEVGGWVSYLRDTQFEVPFLSLLDYLHQRRDDQRPRLSRVLTFNTDFITGLAQPPAVTEAYAGQYHTSAEGTASRMAIKEWRQRQLAKLAGGAVVEHVVHARALAPEVLPPEARRNQAALLLALHASGLAGVRVVMEPPAAADERIAGIAVWRERISEPGWPAVYVEKNKWESPADDSDNLSLESNVWYPAGSDKANELATRWDRVGAGALLPHESQAFLARIVLDGSPHMP